jgi:hypothetical protein
MSSLTDEQRRALRLLAGHPYGCTEAALLEWGFTVVQLGDRTTDVGRVATLCPP